MSRIIVPVKGIRCLHRQCFDKESWLSLKIRPLSCPICTRWILGDEDLLVDPVFVKLLADTPNADTADYPVQSEVSTATKISSLSIPAAPKFLSPTVSSIPVPATHASQTLPLSRRAIDLTQMADTLPRTNQGSEIATNTSYLSGPPLTGSQAVSKAQPSKAQSEHEKKKAERRYSKKEAAKASATTKTTTKTKQKGTKKKDGEQDKHNSPENGKRKKSRTPKSKKKESDEDQGSKKKKKKTFAPTS